MFQIEVVALPKTGRSSEKTLGTSIKADVKYNGKWETYANTRACDAPNEVVTIQSHHHMVRPEQLPSDIDARNRRQLFRSSTLSSINIGGRLLWDKFVIAKFEMPPSR